MDQIQTQGKSALAFKIFAMVSLYAFLIINSLHDLCNPGHVPECIRDEMQEVTLPITQYLDQHKTFRNTLIIVASLMIDFNVIYLTVRWFLFERNYKLLITCLIFYVFRGFLQKVFFMRFPTDYVWGHPGLFSIAVPYAPANDFFFSGHSGFLVLMQSEWGKLGYKKVQRYIQANLIYTIFVLLVCQAHYTIDIFTGVFFADYVFGKVDTNKEAIDKFFKDGAIFVEKVFIKISGRKNEKKEE